MRRFALPALLLFTALAARAEQTPTPGGDAQMPAEPTFVLGNAALNDRNVKVTLYGFVESDTLYDSTQSYSEVQGSGSIAKINSAAGENGRFNFSLRNSRIGLKVDSPETASGIKAMANLEMDFLGFDSVSAVTGTTGSQSATAEANLLAVPTFRMRHGFVKLVTPYLDILVGQYWQLLGGSQQYGPASGTLQGIPGQIYQRTPQIRLGKTIKTGDFSAELEVALQRPYQRDSGMPDLAGFLRLAWDGHKNYRATGGTGGSERGIELTASALTRQFKVLNPQNPVTDTSDYQSATGTGLALDFNLPIIASTKKDRSNGLNISGEFTTGSGDGDVFQSYNAGNGALGTPKAAVANYATGVSLDPGPAGFDNSGATGVLGTVDVKTMFLTAQYFLPIDNGAVFVSAYYGAELSGNVTNFVAAASAIPDVRYVEGDIFWDITSAARVSFAWAKTRMRYGDNSVPRTNDRFQLSAWYVF